MIQVQLDNVSKRYTNHWIIRNANFIFDRPIVYGISGDNGSGKSTLVQLLSGYLTPSVGEIRYTIDNQRIERNDIYKYLGITAPYIDIEEAFTLQRFLEHYSRFKKMQDGLSIADIIGRSGLAAHAQVEIENFSSGMKQRAKLISTLSLDAPMLIMDEPTSYLDMEAKAWLYDHIRQRPSDQLIILASNDQDDLDQCDEIVGIDFFKNKG